MATSARDRVFYKLPEHSETNLSCVKSQRENLLTYVRNNVIGNEKIFSGPYGIRKAIYLDYTASGRSLSFIEDYIRDQVLPEYGNTHTTSNVTSLQTTLYRHEARDIVRNAVHASEHDAVIFVGSGSTGAIHKLIHSLNLDHKPVIFVGPYEHHSNLLPWKDVGAKVLRVKADKQGLIDTEHLQYLLQKWHVTGRQMIGCFSAASNITGILVDVDKINILLHKHGALTFWDYATAAPYVKIDMNPVSASSDQEYMYKDAVFLSCHKFVGGVQTPGILIGKKKLFKNTTPDGCGGGSVFFVRRDQHRYLQEPELKEEGGTPAIVEAIRAGLVFQLKQSITPDFIMEREQFMLKRAREVWKDCKPLVTLGNMEVDRLPIFSFLVYQEDSRKFLHHNYITVLLNDLFGIQARGGCACAGPYAMDLLGMEEVISKQFEDILAEDSKLDRTHLRRYREYSHREILRPGFTRINLPYFLDDETLEFTLEAVKMIAEEGWKLLPQYMFNPETGEWRQRNFQVFKDRKWLGHISYNTGKMEFKIPPLINKGPLPENYKDCLQKAKDLFSQASKTKYQLADHKVMFDERSETLRWFLLPSEAADCIHGNISQNASQLPFCPPTLRESIGLPPFKESTPDVDVLACDMLNENMKHGIDSSDNMGASNDLDSKVVGCQDGVSGEVPVNDSGDSSSETKLDNDGSSVIETFSEGMKACIDEGFQQNSLSDDTGQVNVANPVDEVVESQDSAKSDTNFESDSLKENKLIENKQNSVTSQLVCKMSDQVSTCDTDIKTSAPSSTKSMETSVCPALTCNTGACRKRTVEVCDISQTCDLAVKRSKESCENNSVMTNGGDASDEKNTKGKKNKKKEGNHWFSPPKVIFTPFIKAMEEFDMIKDGDGVLVCLSGGKDSLSLLHTIKQYQYYCRKKNIQFRLGAVTVDPQTPAYDPSPLKHYLASLGVPYFYESQGILEQASNLPYECASICSFCSRMKRGRIYACARREKYNVLALGQHLDDLCESFLMSIFHNGLLRTMKAHYTVEEGDLRVIRPFVYVREKDLRTFAEQNKLPVIAENCPACFEAPKERHRIKQLLASQEIMFPRIFPSLMSAIRPIMAINKTQVKLSDFIKDGNKNDEDEEFDI
ncbi:hypothetical protein ACF0H5_010384 [Mactra antiquata]